jgi:redox-sensitive bicupin YhaK (pirin superfamily)
MVEPVVQTVPLGFQWPAVDPFLFCVHHLDRYPAGNDALGPVASVVGRDLGQDFAGVDGWRMYHGLTVPGFPQHPHRGFETVTFVRRGYIDHSDSLGATARFGRGDVQWLTAGRGVVHSEMFPLLEPDAPNPLELFQIWLNLPAANKLVDPYFTMLWAEDLPHVVTGTDGRRADVTVIAGELDGARPPAPPPDSWASQPGSDVAIWHVVVDPGATARLPAAEPETVRMLYVFEGAATVGTRELVAPMGAQLLADVDANVTGGEHGAEALLLQGRPIGEPVAQYGPFVMNDRAGVEQAFADYRATGFGGWPFATDDPVHPRDAGRFARQPDGRLVRAGTSAS